MPQLRYAAALFCAAALTALAQPHPNFSGTWNLNRGESDFSDKHANPPDRLLLTVQLKDDALTYHLDREKDGKKNRTDVEVTIGAPRQDSDADWAATANWKGDKLEIQLFYNAKQDNQYDQMETWWLSADGNKLVDETLVHLPKNGGEARIRRVFDRQR